MRHQLLQGCSFLGVFFKAADQEVFEVLAGELPLLTSGYLLGNIFSFNIISEIICFFTIEGEVPLEKHIEHHAEAPDVGLEVELLMIEHFWTHIRLTANGLT